MLQVDKLNRQAHTGYRHLSRRSEWQRPQARRCQTPSAHHVGREHCARGSCALCTMMAPCLRHKTVVELGRLQHYWDCEDHKHSTYNLWARRQICHTTIALFIYRQPIKLCGKCGISRQAELITTGQDEYSSLSMASLQPYPGWRWGSRSRVCRRADCRPRVCPQPPSAARRPAAHWALHAKTEIVFETQHIHCQVSAGSPLATTCNVPMSATQLQHTLSIHLFAEQHNHNAHLQMVGSERSICARKGYSPVTPPFGGQPSASMPSSAAALAPSFSMRALYSGSHHALHGKGHPMRPYACVALKLHPQHCSLTCDSVRKGCCACNKGTTGAQYA